MSYSGTFIPSACGAQKHGLSTLDICKDPNQCTWDVSDRYSMWNGRTGCPPTFFREQTPEAFPLQAHEGSASVVRPYRIQDHRLPNRDRIYVCTGANVRGTSPTDLSGLSHIPANTAIAAFRPQQLQSAICVPNLQPNYCTMSLKCLLRLSSILMGKYHYFNSDTYM